MPLTPEAKKLLAETIRGTAQDPEKGIRARLLRAIHDEADRRYRLSVPTGDAGLDEAHRRRRERIEAWIDERARATKPKNKAELKATKERLLAQAEKEAAATAVNRLVLLRHLEALGLSRPAVVTGGWNSKGYREFREFAPTLCTNGTTDATEGYGTLLELVFDELAVDLPGVFGEVGLTRLFPIPAATLRDVIERLDAPALASAWTDDTTLGWVYQYWNDPDREALDAKINGGGKIEPHEIASKTQMFTERYMVEWLLQNSLGLTWLAMCKKSRWTADAERVLPVLDARRAEWRKRREAGEVALDALMPIEGELEEHWKYYVPQPIPDDAVEKAPESVRAIKILDPACGSGHFLVIAFDLLAALYREEARHLGTTVTDREIAESIVEKNLHGIDIDPRAVQIAAAGLYLKARSLAKAARPKRVNLVAPVLQLGNLPADDPAIVALRRDLKRDVGIPEELTTRLLTSLAGVDYLGSLLKVDAAVEEAIKDVELEFERSHGQGDLFRGFSAQQVKLPVGAAKATILEKLEQFLAKHSKSGDLGLRLDGEQLAAGVRFVRMAKEDTYDLVVGNPPYQGLSKTNSFGYVAAKYPKSKADLYAAFLERGLEFTRPGGASALLTMRGWMFLGQFAELRKALLKTNDLRSIGDFDRGAFDEVPNEVLAVCVPIFRRAPHPGVQSVAIQPTPLDDKSYDRQRTNRKRAVVLAHVGRYEFDPRGFEVIEGEPIVYWWSKELLGDYQRVPTLARSAAVRLGVRTSDNVRFLRVPWELGSQVWPLITRNDYERPQAKWVPYIKGAEGRQWLEPLNCVVLWLDEALELKVKLDWAYGMSTQSPEFHFVPGVAFSMIGANFRARAHRFHSVIGDKGSSAFAHDVAQVVAVMNTTRSRRVVESLNPSVSFQVGDVARIPFLPVPGAADILGILKREFAAQEAACEASVEFRCPGPSAWISAQAWAQHAVDRPDGASLPPYQPVYDPPAPESFVSFAIGVAIGRFGASGEGILDVAPAGSLPSGILFVSSERGDSIDQAPCAPIVAAWKEHGAAVGDGDDLRTYLRKSFFGYHRKLYENRPIYFPLSSAKKSFVAFISIHRWADDTLNVLLADHLVPTKRRLEGELDDLRTARASGNNKGKAERRFTEVQKLLEELNDFIVKVTEIAEKGPPPPDDKTPRREVDARYVMELDDGVMVNSAALWPLLEPQWKDPKKWWKELATAQGKKDYDWSHLAARYFSARVRKKCHDDPSLAVAHKCFWELHPAKAYAWELRLQDEIRPDFTIDEPASNAARAKFLAEHDREAREILAKEQKRRDRKTAAASADDDSGAGPLFEQDENAPEEPDD
ncbi:BREX-6 system adenine-specific DNA-methyltransferase PglX [Sorangium cellulosum]|uniref:site-specific DNA-methyltransferase (adenine-specific) n=1 Tax=Sorangium cellulosum TaxID=56 RepID=A0A150QJI4_SORCE|nr:BREX-6 system adenine-specific DNA-methyltransferase PglX [Sorangium cellulosum]KYF68124.1 type II restriction endonuclease [Sorangium cellulosum]